MNLNDFVNKWTGQTVDFDGVYPNQCMDLMHQYVYDVLGITDKRALAQPAAYQVYTSFSSDFDNQYFDLIPNTPTAVPQAGDIVVFGQSVGEFGHVCIFISGDVNSFTSFDANWPLGSLPHQQLHPNYNGVLGWLRFKGANLTQNLPQVPQYLLTILQEHNLDLANESQIRVFFQQALDYPGTKTDLDNARATLDTNNAQINQLNAQVGSLQSKLDARAEQISALQAQITTLSGTTPPETASITPDPSNSDLLISQLSAILYSSGFWWTKWFKIKSLLPH